MYKIKLFSQITGISEFNLRYFDQIGLLPAMRDQSNYRIYHPHQISLAHLIISLQEAGLSNEKIKIITSDYLSPNTELTLSNAQKKIDEIILHLQRSTLFLTKQIDRINKISQARSLLNKPFTEKKEAETLGAFSLDTLNIIDFFKHVEDISGNPEWYLQYRYGFILNLNEIMKNGYRLTTFFCDEPYIINTYPEKLSAGEFISGFYPGSLENNPAVFLHLSQSCQHIANFHENILIEYICGPAMTESKTDFMIKVMCKILPTR